jgi:hypothetical protein
MVSVSNQISDATLVAENASIWSHLTLKCRKSLIKDKNAIDNFKSVISKTKDLKHKSSKSRNSQSPPKSSTLDTPSPSTLPLPVSVEKSQTVYPKKMAPKSNQALGKPPRPFVIHNANATRVLDTIISKPEFSQETLNQLSSLASDKGSNRPVKYEILKDFKLKQDESNSNLEFAQCLTGNQDVVVLKKLAHGPPCVPHHSQFEDVNEVAKHTPGFVPLLDHTFIGPLYYLVLDFPGVEWECLSDYKQLNNHISAQGLVHQLVYAELKLMEKGYVYGNINGNLPLI